MEIPEFTIEEKLARARIVLPLDNLNTMEAAEGRVKHLAPYVGHFKVGMGSNTRFGHDILKMVHKYEAEVFLDLKFHDIPNTAEDASSAAAELANMGISMFNVHASGGPTMLEAAARGARDYAEKRGTKRPKVLGVTVLTSLDEPRVLHTYPQLNPALAGIDFVPYLDCKKNADKGPEAAALYEEFQMLLDQYELTGFLERQILHFAQMSRKAGLDGIVCSAADVHYLKEHLPTDFEFVTPGVKGTKRKAGDDQQRVLTPGQAIQDGSTRLVIGRAITGSAEDALSYEAQQQNAYDAIQDMAPYMEA